MNRAPASEHFRDHLAVASIPRLPLMGVIESRTASRASWAGRMYCTVGIAKVNRQTVTSVARRFPKEDVGFRPTAHLA